MKNEEIISCLSDSIKVGIECEIIDSMYYSIVIDAGTYISERKLRIQPKAECRKMVFTT